MVSMVNTMLSLVLLFLSISPLQCFVPLCTRRNERPTTYKGLATDSTKEVTVVPKVGDLLGKLPTPSLLLELSLAEGALQDAAETLDDIFADPTRFACLDGALFVHTSVTSTENRDSVNQEVGSGKSLSVCRVDVTPQQIHGGAYLGLGLANHHVGGYYWARGMGMGASLPAHGILFGPAVQERTDNDDETNDDSTGADAEDGELFWKKRGPGQNAQETTEESSNSNDGKRSEWADFLTKGDTVQLVPENVAAVLKSTEFPTLIGMRRIGRPLGADPIVEMIWECDGDTWKRQ